MQRPIHWLVGCADGERFEPDNLDLDPLKFARDRVGFGQQCARPIAFGLDAESKTFAEGFDLGRGH